MSEDNALKELTSELYIKGNKVLLIEQVSIKDETVTTCIDLAAYLQED